MCLGLPGRVVSAVAGAPLVDVDVAGVVTVSNRFGSVVVRQSRKAVTIVNSNGSVDVEAAAGAPQPRPELHNCSGKHAGMLLASARRGFDLETYRDPEHPLQGAVLEAVREAAGEPQEAHAPSCANTNQTPENQDGHGTGRPKPSEKAPAPALMSKQVLSAQRAS